MLAAIGGIALLGIGGALIYALQTRDDEPAGDELYSVENRPTADGLSDLPRDYTGPVLGPPLPGDLGGPILDAQNRGQPVAPPTITAPAVDPEEQRRLAEEEAARTSRVFFQTAPAAGATPSAAVSSLAGLDLASPVRPDRPSVLPRERISTLCHSRALLAEIDTISRQASSISLSWRNRMRPDSLGSRVSFHFPEANKRAKKPGRYVCARPDNSLLNATIDMPEHPDSNA